MASGLANWVWAALIQTTTRPITHLLTLDPRKCGDAAPKAGEALKCCSVAASIILSLRSGWFARFAFRGGPSGLGFASRLALARRRTSRGGIFLGGFFVLFAAIIGSVKARALEYQASAGADGAFDLAFAPAFPGAKGFRADGQRPGGNGLNSLKLMSAFFANVFVGRHNP